MARGNVQQRSYLTCSRGKWRERVTESTPDAVARTITPDEPGKPYTVFEIVNDYVSGIIRSIEVQDDQKGYGRQWLITIQDGEEVLCLQFRYDSGYAMAFLSKLPVVDLEQPVSFHPYYFDEERKARLVLKQDNENVPSYFTKEEPKGFPVFPEEGDDIKDDIVIWKIEVMKFLVAYLNKEIIPKLPGKPENISQETITEESAQSDAQRDDIPPPTGDDVPGGYPKEIRSNQSNDDMPF